MWSQFLLRFSVPVYVWSKSSKILFILFQLDMWRHPRKGNHSMDVYVEPEKLEPVLGALKDIGAHVKIWIDDLQK